MPLLTTGISHHTATLETREKIAIARTDYALRVKEINDLEGVEEVVEHLQDYSNPTSQMRLIRMHGRRDISYADLHNSYDWKQVSAMIAELDQSPWMELDV